MKLHARAVAPKRGDAGATRPQSDTIAMSTSKQDESAAGHAGWGTPGDVGAVLTDPCLFGALTIFRVPFQHSRIRRLCVSAMFCLISSSMGLNMARSNERMILGVYRNDSSVVISGHTHHVNFGIGMHRQLDGRSAVIC